MSIKAYESAPYYDDFNSSNIESKNYLRILFKPGYSVQVRELNQLQSSLQSQIDKLGKSIYKEGPILEGGSSFSNDLNYIDVTIDSSVNTFLLSQLNRLNGSHSTSEGGAILRAVKLDSGSYITDNNKPKAEIYHYQLISSAVTGIGNYSYRFYIRYTDSGATGTNVGATEFTTGQNLSFDNGFGVSPQVISSSTRLGQITKVGYAASFTADRGVFFGKGSFIFNEEAKTVYIAKPNKSKQITGRFVFKFVETTKSFASDTTLNDNSNGTPNAQAPGADRYQVSLEPMFLINSTTDKDLLASTKSISSQSGTGDTLNSTAVDTEASASEAVNYISLLRINKNVYQPTRGYTQLDDQLAVRTFEESGDYVVNTFKVSVREHLNNTTGNNGRYLSADGGVEPKFVATIEPGIGYVKGYRVENPENVEIVVDKARTTSSNETVFVSQKIGQYIEGTIGGSNGANVPKLDPSETYTFSRTHNSVSSDGGGFSTTSAHNMPGASGDIVTCRIRSFEKIQGVSKFRAHIYDITGEIPRGALYLVGDDAEDDDDTFVLVLSETNIANPQPIFDTSDTESFIKLPYATINAISDTVNGAVNDSEVTRQVVQTGITLGASSHTLSASGGSSRFWSDSTDSYIITKESDGSNVVVTNVSGAGTSSVTLSYSGTPGACTIISSQKVGLTNDATGLSRKTKTSTTVSAEAVTTASVTTNTTLDLDYHDAYEIVSATQTNTANPVALSDLELDTGQRDGVYKLSKVRYKGSSNITGLKVTYKYFAHGGGDYFDKDSYSTVEYASIPSYKDIVLSDVIDFRGKDTDTSTVALDPGAAAKITLNYYKARSDRFIITSNGDFKIISGVPAQNPELPKVPDDAMALYNIHVPAYTKKIGDIILRSIDNKRFTMRDIGKLEKRIENLEFYTSLSLLEREANGKQILDSSDGTERFKNGILVDSFQSQNIGDATDPGFKVAYDLDNGELRPSFTTKNVRLVVPTSAPTNGASDDQSDGVDVAADKFNRSNYTLGSNTSTTVTSTDGLGDYLIMPYSEEVLIEQNQASMSMSVNPYDMATWNGTVELSPSSDEWKETSRRPDVVMNINGSADALAQVINANDALGTVWNEWERNGAGKKIGTKYKQIHGQGVTAVKQAAGFNQWHPVRKVTTTFSQPEIRSGISQEAVVNEVQQAFGDRVVDITFIPFIRTRKVAFKAQLLKPNTRMYAFFDGVDVSNYCTKGTFEEYKDSTTADTTTDGETAITTAPASLGGASRVELVSDNNGQLEGFFFIPQNDTHRFRTGIRKFKLTDSNTNNLADTMTSASTEYSAQGIIQTVEGQIISTRQLQLQDGDRVTENRMGVRTETKTEYYDPLAQSFLIGNIPTGCYATSLDLYFSAKSSNVPLSAHIVTCENGIPTQKIVPKSKVIKLPSEVYTDSTARDATKFDFKDPIYLKPGVEYAIVVMSNSPDYRLFMAETGLPDVTTNTQISKNTYAGVSFKSQNASTWTPDQNRDFKFTLRRAKFTNTANDTPSDAAPATQGYKLHPQGLSSSNKLSFSVLRLLSQEINLPETSLLYTLGIDGTDFSIVSNENLYFDGVKEFEAAGVASGGHVDVVFSTTSEFVSPVIDLERVSLLGVDNVISTQETSTGAAGRAFGDAADLELQATHGGATARYITKEVQLNNAANQLNIFFAANRPSEDTNIEVYVRTKVDGRIQDKTFTYVSPQEPVFVSSANEFRDSEFIYSQNDSFSAFQVKVVFTSLVKATAPRIKDFRAIATT